MQTSGTDARLPMNGTRSVRSMCSAVIWVHIDTTNHPVWNAATNSRRDPSPCSSGNLPPATAGQSRVSNTVKVTISNSELTGPKRLMNRAIDAVSHRAGERRTSPSTRSHGIARQARSYMRFSSTICTGAMGTNGRNAPAIITEMILPKFELSASLMYFIMLTQVRLLCVMPRSSTSRFLCVSMTSADCRTASEPVLALMAISLACMAGRSLTPSPMYPTQCPSRRSSETIRALCSGVSLANTFTRRSSVPSAVSVMSSSVRPVTTRRALMPTFRATVRATCGSSPVSMVTVMPALCMWAIVSAASGLGRSRKVR